VGKSSLLNTLVTHYGHPKEQIYADNKLFATLDPTTRRIRMPSGRWVLFTDTVGFIKKLPTHLIAAFRSTLEETINADILIHLLDASHPNKEEQTKAVIQILKLLHHGETSFLNKMITVYNKIDLLVPEEKNSILRQSKKADPPFLALSVTQQKGILSLLNSIEQHLKKNMIGIEFDIPFERLKILPSLYYLGRVESVTHKNMGMHLRMYLEKSHWAKIQQMLK
jgi:GTP-binding protein HflX